MMLDVTSIGVRWLAETPLRNRHRSIDSPLRPRQREHLPVVTLGGNGMSDKCQKTL